MTMSLQTSQPMDETATTDLAVIGVRLLDTAYMSWRFAALECEHTQHAWATAAGRDAQAGYFAYCAALDREEAAARDLQRLSELAGPCESVLAQQRAV